MKREQTRVLASNRNLMEQVKIKFKHRTLATCSVVGCTSVAYAHGICNLHYQRLWNQSRRRAAHTKTQRQAKVANQAGVNR